VGGHDTVDHRPVMADSELGSRCLVRTCADIARTIPIRLHRPHDLRQPHETEATALSGFKVNPETLRAYQLLLDTNVEFAQDIRLYPNSAYMTPASHTGTLYTEATLFDQRAHDRASERQGAVHDRLFWSAYGMEKAVEVYRRTDDANEARLDATYQKSPGHKPATHGDPYPASFGSERIDHILADEVEEIDPNGLKPKATAIEDGLNWISDQLSIYKWVQWILVKIGAGDPFTAMLNWISGDWKAWARAAYMWQNCGKAYEVVASNVDKHRELHDWQGNAADAAYDYFSKVAAGIRAEKAFYDLLFDRYKQITEVVYDAFKACDFILGFIIDTVVTLGAGAVVKIGTKAHYLIKLCDDIGTILNTANSTVILLRMDVLDGSAGGSEPPCPIEQLAPPKDTPSGRGNGYRHPGEVPDAA
jgi:hypothetical protein